MKVKNIMFFGFAAAILSMGAASAAATGYQVVAGGDNAGVASATAYEGGRKIVASKSYVDLKGDQLKVDINNLTTTVNSIDTNVQSNWTATEGAAQILNKPDTADAGTDITGITAQSTAAQKGALTTAEAVHDALGTITSNVQSNWTATSGDAQILNKPDTAAADTDISGITAQSTAAQKGALTTAEAVHDFVTGQISDLDLDNSYADVNLSNLSSTGTAVITDAVKEGAEGADFTTTTTGANALTSNTLGGAIDEVAVRVAAIPSAQTGTLTVAGKGSGASQTFSANQTTGDALNVTLRDLPVKPSSCNGTDPCTLLQTGDGYGWFHMVTDVTGSATTASSVATNGSLILENN